MAIYLADTNIIINHFHGDNMATNFLSTANIYLSYISKAELIRGAKDKQSLKKLLRFVDSFEIDYGSKETNGTAIEILAKHQLTRGIGIMDSIIAATAITNNYVLVTENIRHFREIDGLMVRNLANLG